MLPDDLVLVALVKSPRDLEIIHTERWYRLPQQHAPEHFNGAQYVAFYLTNAFGRDKWSVCEFAPVRGHELVRRRDLLPTEADHPRADDQYYKLQLGPIQSLGHRIISKRGRRLLFIWTTGEKFLGAREINDLLGTSPEDDALWHKLKARGYDVERQLLVREGRTRYRVDYLIYCPQGKIAVFLGEAQPIKSSRTFRVLALNGRFDSDHTLKEIDNQVKELSAQYTIKKGKDGRLQAAG